MDGLIPPAHLWLPGVIAMLALIVASGFFSGSETALFFLSHEELRSLRTGRAAERTAAALLQNPDRLLTAVLFWNLVINLTYFATSIVVAERLTGAGYTAAAGLFGISGLLTIILLGEVLPKSVAVAFRRRLAALVSWPLAASIRVLDPVMPALSAVTRTVRRTIWPNVRHEPFLQAEDLERAVELSQLDQHVLRQETMILHNVLDLSEITVEEVMRPRGTYLALPRPVGLADLKGEVPPGGYVVLQGEAADEIEGVIPLLDFAAVPDERLEDAAEGVICVPWCATLANVLSWLRERFLSVATVVDEHGGTIGIVTYEDIIDTVLVSQPSRARRLLQREPVLEITPGRYRVEGITTLRYLCRRLGIDYEPEPDGPVTVAGVLYEELEHLPEAGDECLWQGYRLRVEDVQSRGWLRVIVEKPEQGEW